MLKKSQVTVFIIIALVLVMMVGVTYYMIGSRMVEKSEEAIVIQQISAAKIKPVNDYVESCLSLASSEGLGLLGKQGGYIYKSQRGIVEDPLPGTIGKTYIDYEQTIARYGIHSPISNVGTLFFAETPDYPWPTFPIIYDPLDPSIIVYEEYLDGYYGMNEVPHLEKPEENSIQEQLEKFAVNSMIDCADWTVFAQQGLNISAGAPNVSILFTEGDVVFNLDWPIEIKDLAAGATTKLDTFVVVYPIRMKKILDFTQLITDKDVTEISYDIQASDGLITAYRTQDVYGQDDLITIRDEESMMLDKQYEFMFVRENRAPALYYIHEIVVEVCVNSIVAEEQPNQLKVSDACGVNSYVLNFTALDPDEESVNFSYSKELPHRISLTEANIGRYNIKVRVTDNEYEDWQEIKIPAKVG